MMFSTIAFAAATVCRLSSDLDFEKTKTPCSIHGDAVAGGKRVFILNCERPALGQIEYVEDAPEAAIVDPVSREKKVNCAVDRTAVKQLISAYRNLVKEPRCRLEKKAGQMTFFDQNTPSRCSFRMNREAYAQFVKATGKKPFYQCEHDIFILSDQISDAQVYKLKQQNWVGECSAHLHVLSGKSAEDPAQDPVEYYQPREPTFIP